MLCLKPSHTDSTALVIRKLQTNSSDSYSTRDFPCGTPPTQSDDTPCIMMYVWRNLYVAMYHTYQSSPRKILYQYLACRPHASASKTHLHPCWLTPHYKYYVERYCNNILLIKPIILHIHLHSFHTLYTPWFRSAPITATTCYLTAETRPILRILNSQP